MPAPVLWRVRFDEARWQDDLRGATTAAVAQAAAWRQRIAVLRGLPHLQLRACRARDDAGLDLPHCVKTYIPKHESASVADSPWTAVLEVQEDGGGYFLAFVAFGLRHPEAIGSMKPSVYAIAYRRLSPAD